MPRAKNNVETVQITISSTPQVKGYLEQLAQGGVFGKNAADAAERLITEKIRDLITSGELQRIPPQASTT